MIFNNFFKVLDCEKHPTEFNFRVKATDEGTPTSLYTVVPLKITLTNINDRIPKFVDLKILSVRLPAYQGMIVERLKAKDYDVVPDELTFEMEDQLGVFDIHPKTGFYNLTFYTVESPSSDMGAILYFFLLRNLSLFLLRPFHEE